MQIKERLRSPVLWTATAALIFFVVKEWCGIEIPRWDTFVDLVITLAVAFGIMNNPADHNNF